jgi:hypothetical protein
MTPISMLPWHLGHEVDGICCSYDVGRRQARGKRRDPSAIHLLSEKSDWCPSGMRKQPLGDQYKNHESEHYRVEQRIILLDLGTMKATFSGHGANTSLLAL